MLAAYSLWDWRWIATVLVIALSYFLGCFYYNVSKYPRGPLPWPVVGNLLTLRKVSNLAIKADEWSMVYGEVFTMWMAHKPMIVLNTYEAICETFLGRRHEFAGRISTNLGQLQTQGHHDIFFEDYNPRWKALRKVGLLALRKYALSKPFEKLCTDVVDTYVESLQMGSQIVDARNPLIHILYTIVGVSVYGARPDHESSDIQRLEELDLQLSKYAPNGLPSDIAPLLGILYRHREKKIQSIFREFRQIVDVLFTKAEASYVSGNTENLAHALLTAREEAIREEKGDAEYLTKGNLVQVVLNIFLGGTDTSAEELHWLLLCMVRDPGIQEKIQKEIQDNLGSRPPAYSDREKLPFTVACLTETLRCYPISPLGVPHKTTTDTKVGHLAIPKDTGVLYNVYRVHHDPKLWEQPEKFRPERFLDAATGKLRRDAFPLITFGVGPRKCPGEKLAHVDMFYIIVRLMQRLSCSAADEPPNVDVDGLGSGLFLTAPEQKIVLTRRN